MIAVYFHRKFVKGTFEGFFSEIFSKQLEFLYLPTFVPYVPNGTMLLALGGFDVIYLHRLVQQRMEVRCRLPARKSLLDICCFRAGDEPFRNSKCGICTTGRAWSLYGATTLKYKAVLAASAVKRNVRKFEGNRKRFSAGLYFNCQTNSNVSAFTCLAGKQESQKSLSN